MARVEHLFSRPSGRPLVTTSGPGVDPTSTTYRVESACSLLGQVPSSATGAVSIARPGRHFRGRNERGDGGGRRFRITFPDGAVPDYNSRGGSSSSPLFLRRLLCVPFFGGRGLLRPTSTYPGGLSCAAALYINRAYLYVLLHNTRSCQASCCFASALQRDLFPLPVGAAFSLGLMMFSFSGFNFRDHLTRIRRFCLGPGHPPRGVASRQNADLRGLVLCNFPVNRVASYAQVNSESMTHRAGRG